MKFVRKIYISRLASDIFLHHRKMFVSLAQCGVHFVKKVLTIMMNIVSLLVSCEKEWYNLFVKMITYDNLKGLVFL